MKPEDFEGPPEPKRLKWEYKTQFGISEKMKDVIELTIKVAEAEVAAYQRKLEKLTYGS